MKNGFRSFEGFSFESATHHNRISPRRKTTAFENVIRDHYIIESNTIATLSLKRARITLPTVSDCKGTFRLSAGKVFNDVLPFAKRWVDLRLKSCARAQQAHSD